MKFKTAITQVNREVWETVRGEPLSELISKRTFSETIFLILKGTLPPEAQARMINAILTATIDHGPATASALCARISASAKNPMHTALAAGILGFGERHGSAVESAMNFFYAHKEGYDVPKLVRDMKARKEYVPGFGHKVFTEHDPRSVALFDIARDTNIYGAYCELAHTLHKEINAVSSKPLPMNVDGAIAAILCDMGFDSRLGNGIFMIGRVPGLVAHIFEEMTTGQGIRRLDDGEVEYMNN